jgi:hypothetical protein
MDTTIRCNGCGREMGLTEFLTYPKAYLIKRIAPALVPIFVSLLVQNITNNKKGRSTYDTRGMIDTSMAGLAENFSIHCPNCGELNWYPASGKKPRKKKTLRDEI